MSLTINHNLMASSTARNLAVHYDSLGSSTRRLSSGLRINQAADDAAGLTVREMMRADVRTLGQGIRNANDAISMIQVADGALQVIDEKLIRMKELATQAATGTYNADQRSIINDEFQAMKAEINRIAESTEFNGIKLLNGNPNSNHSDNNINSIDELKIHFGSTNCSSEDYYYINLESSSINNLFSIESESVTPTPQETGYVQNSEIIRVDSGISAASRGGLVAVQNSIGHIFLAWTSYFQTGSAAISGFARFINQNGNILTDEIKLIDNNFGAEFDINAISNGSSIYATWTGREAPDTDPDYGIYGESILYNISKENLEHINTYTTNRQGNSDAIILSNGEKIVVWDSEQQDGDSYGIYGQRIDNSGLTGVEFNINDTTIGAQNFPRVEAFNNDNFMVIWTGEDSGGSGVFGKIYDINGNDLSGEFKVNNQEANNEQVSGMTKLTNGNILVYWESQNYPNSVNIYGKIYNQNGFIVKDEFLINQQTTAINNGATVNATEDGFFVSYSSNQTGVDMLYGTIFDNNGSRISEESHIPFSSFGESLYLGNNQIMMAGISGAEINVQIFNMPTNRTSITETGELFSEDQINTITQKNSQNLLPLIDKAIIKKDKIRANLGATQNRLENTITNLQIQTENLQAAESRISDADVAQEMTAFVKEQILTQSAVAMLAQANTLPQMALQIIQG